MKPRRRKAAIRYCCKTEHFMFCLMHSRYNPPARSAAIHSITRGHEAASRLLCIPSRACLRGGPADQQRLSICSRCNWRSVRGQEMYGARLALKYHMTHHSRTASSLVHVPGIAVPVYFHICEDRLVPGCLALSAPVYHTSSTL